MISCNLVFTQISVNAYWRGILRAISVFKILSENISLPSFYFSLYSQGNLTRKAGENSREISVSYSLPCA